MEMVIDIEDVAYRATSSMRRFFNSTQMKINRFVSSGNEALEDLKTLVTVDDDRRVIIACRRSSLQFFGNFILWGLVVVVAVRVLMELGFLGFRGGYGGGFVWRRDRSLAGKEVVVAKRRFKEREGKKKDLNFRVPINPLTPARDTTNVKITEAEFSPRKHATSEERLPKWWPVSVPSSLASNPTMNSKESQKEADIVMRAIMDNRMSGKDITEDDIIQQFRQICKRSGARVLIETANARDSFYRASVDLVMNACSRSINHSTVVQIDGENAQHFVAGIAFNIGLDSIRAAKIVSAAVAARTRSWFLQAWALEMQGKRMEAVEELSKICLIHQIFPPEESSPEMEMVARGLEKHLRREQREFLFDLLVEICGAGSRRSAAEALGLVQIDSPKYRDYKQATD
ncbi:hypothetical protein BVC80_8205g4 [Macleaya cordata]|uniref:Uncharacterized protein n=1 Tax=Macleaya cordata TaxID=56857 RepID=A0A200QMQ6_MACCD|nr:hypothetical protein BVC80_8205g4 [Macleaya cordata]